MSARTGTVYINSKASDDQGQAQKDPHKEQLDELAKRAGLIIFETASRNFLLNSAKDKLTICPNRVTISRRNLFSRDEYPMPIENITNASVFTHLMSASMTIETFGIPKPDSLNNLNINEARLARRYILGLVECKKAKIDLTGFDLKNLREKLKSIGMVQYTTSEKDYHKL